MIEIKMNLSDFITTLMFKPELMAQLVDQKGDAFIIKLPKKKLLVLSSDRFIKYIFIENPKNFARSLGPAATPLNRILGETGLNAIDDYSEWKKHRQNLSLLFQMDPLKNYAELMTQSFTKVLETLEPLADGKTPINMDKFYSRAALTDLMESLFRGTKVDIGYISSLQRELVYWSRPFVYYKYIKYLGLIPVPPFYFRYKRLLKQFDDWFSDFVKQSFGNNVPDYNLLKHIIISNGYKSFDQLDKEAKEYLYDEATNFIFAGYETSSALLGQISVYLSRYPMIAEKLQQETDQVLGGRIPTPDDLKNLPYTLAVLKEGLRIQPPQLVIFRKVINDASINGYDVKKNDVIMFPVLAVQRSRKYWDNPEGFDPSRFLKPLTPEQRIVFMPFGEGERMCLGNNLALLQSTMILSMMMARYRLELLPGALLTRDEKSVINRIKNLNMTIHKRTK